MTKARGLLPRWAFDLRSARRKQIRTRAVVLKTSQRKRMARSPRARREWGER